MLNILVRLRVELVVIDPVYDSAQGIAPGPHQPLQLLPVKRHLDLLGVRIAHRGDSVRVHQSAL